MLRLREPNRLGGGAARARGARAQASRRLTALPVLLLLFNTTRRLPVLLLLINTTLETYRFPLHRNGAFCERAKSIRRTHR